MPNRQRYFLIVIAVSLLSTLAFLFMEKTARSASLSAPAGTTPSEAEDVVSARSEDGALALTLEAPRGSFWFGRQEIAVQVQLPSGDRIKTIDFFVDGGLMKTLAEPPYRIQADFGEEIVSHSLVVIAQTGAGRAARLSRISRPAHVDSRVEVSLVTMPVAVIGADGRFVSRLDLSDFTLDEEEVEQTLVHFDRDPTPASVVVALDSSDSMQGSFWSAQKAANEFVATLPPYDKVCLIGFSDAARVAKEFTFDRRSLAFAVSSMKPAGNTALYDALGTAGEQLASRPDRRVAVVFSDGGETQIADPVKARDRLSEALRAARESGVTFYTVAFGPRADKEVLRRIAEETGGESFDSSDPAALPGIFARISQSLEHQYTLSYYPTRPISEGGWRSVSIHVRVPGAIVRSRPGYLAGPIPPPPEETPAPLPAARPAKPPAPPPAPAELEDVSPPEDDTIPPAIR
ncbi:MAG TPA: VWA domain-containing protein [Candidatus Polarisedimenticolia bacterium]|nr:VWA domain-containing protein [Candidatus Polarisedimenticolia bacterium]